MNTVTIQRQPGVPFEVINAALLNLREGGFENAHEQTIHREYYLDDKLVHRSAHVQLKQWPAGFEGLIAAPVSRGIMPSDMDPAAPAMRHLRLLRDLKAPGLRFANTQAASTSFKVEILNGIHAFGTTVVRGATTKDSLKAALFLASATKDASTTGYNTTGEVSGTNYTAGGVAVTTGTAPNSSGTTAFFTPSASIVYTTVTLATAFDCMQLYNSTQGDKSIAIFTFGSQTITAGTFTLTMPTNDASNALIRIA